MRSGGRKEDLLIRIRMELSRQEPGLTVEQIGERTRGLRHKRVGQLESHLVGLLAKGRLDTGETTGERLAFGRYITKEDGIYRLHGGGFIMLKDTDFFRIWRAQAK